MKSIKIEKELLDRIAKKTLTPTGEIDETEAEAVSRESQLELYCKDRLEEVNSPDIAGPGATYVRAHSEKFD